MNMKSVWSKRQEILCSKPETNWMRKPASGAPGTGVPKETGKENGEGKRTHILGGCIHWMTKGHELPEMIRKAMEQGKFRK